MPVIYLVGDSTVTDNTPPFRGWGWALPEYCKPGVEVSNHAESGCSSKSFLVEGRFAPIAKNIQDGDVLLIQFGHNDEKPDAERRTEVDTSFPIMLSIYIDIALAKGATPILITPVSRRWFNEEGLLTNTHGLYPEAIRRLANERNIPLVDLYADSRVLLEKLGSNKAAELFVQLAPGEHPDFKDGHNDLTHFNAFGAIQIASLVAKRLASISNVAELMKP